MTTTQHNDFPAGQRDGTEPTDSTLPSLLADVETQQPLADGVTTTGTTVTEVRTSEGRHFEADAPKDKQALPAGSTEAPAVEQPKRRMSGRAVGLTLAGALLAGGAGAGVAVLATSGGEKSDGSNAGQPIPGSSAKGTAETAPAPNPVTSTSVPAQSKSVVVASGSKSKGNGPVIPGSGESNGDTPPQLKYPDRITSIAQPAGNLDPSTAPAGGGTSFTWENSQWFSPDFNQPSEDQESINAVSNQVIRNVSILATLDPSSQEYKEIINNVAANDAVKNYIGSLNKTFHSEGPGGLDNPAYKEQCIIFDTQAEPANFVSQGVNEYGLEGHLYIRMLNSDSGNVQGDKEGLVPEDAWVITNLKYSLTVADDGSVKISNLFLHTER